MKKIPSDKIQKNVILSKLSGKRKIFKKGASCEWNPILSNQPQTIGKITYKRDGIIRLTFLRNWVLCWKHGERLVISKVSVNCSIPRFDRGAGGSLWKTTPTEDAKASSAFFHTVDFTGAYGVSHFSSNTLRVLTSAVAPGRLGFTHLHALTACVCKWRN